MKKVIIILFVVFFTNPFLVFAQEEPTLKIKMIPMLTLTGNPGERFEIQYSSDLGKTDPWKVLEIVSVYNDPVIYCDTSEYQETRRFYRAVQIDPIESLEYSEDLQDLNYNVLIDTENDQDNIEAYLVDISNIGINITIQKIVVSFENGETTSSELISMIDQVSLYLNGANIGKENFSVSEVCFDADNYEILEGDSVELSVSVDLNEQIGNYENGSSLFVSDVTIYYTDQSGNPGVLTGPHKGGLRVLRGEGAMFELTETEHLVFEDNKSTKISFTFQLEPFNEDIYLPTNGSSVSFEILNENGDILDLSTSIDLYSESDDVENHFIIQDGETESLTFSVTIDNSSELLPHTVRIRLRNIGCRFGSTTESLVSAPLVIPENTQSDLIFLQN